MTIVLLKENVKDWIDLSKCCYDYSNGVGIQTKW